MLVVVKTRIQLCLLALLLTSSLQARPYGGDDATGGSDSTQKDAGGPKAAAPFLHGGQGWHEMPNTKLQTSNGVNTDPAICPPNNFGNSGYGFSDSCRWVWEAWNGGTIDDDQERLLIWGGGHSDYSGNELYALRYGKTIPDLVRLTNPTVPISVKGRGFIPDNCANEGFGADCRPNSRHTYGGIAYLPDGSHKMYVHGGSVAPTGYRVKDLWSLDASSCINPVKGAIQVDPCNWTRLDTCGTGQHDATCRQNPYPDTGSDQMYWAWDRQTLSYYAYTPNGCAFWNYNPKSNTWKPLDSGVCTGVADTAAEIDPVNRYFVFVGHGHLYAYSLSSPHKLADHKNGTGCAAPANTYYGGVAFDPVDNLLIVFPETLGNFVYTINTATWTCNSETYSGGPAPNPHITDPNNYHGIMGRVRYSAKEDAFIMHPYPTMNAWFLRRRGEPSSATSDFLKRCNAAGVIVCQGFDTAAIATCHKHSYNASGFYAGTDDDVTCPKLDSSTYRSGFSSALYTIPSQAGSDPTGSWRQFFQGDLDGTANTSHTFGPPGQPGTDGNHFYIQYSQKGDHAFFTNKWPYTGGGLSYWKQQIIARGDGSCGGEELTTVNAYNGGFPQMYSNCGSELLQVPLAGGDALLQQGDYNCHYQNPPHRACFYYRESEWMTFYYDVELNSFGGANSVVKAYVSVNGQSYKQWINIPNFVQYQDGAEPGYNMIYLFPYMTGRDKTKSAGPVAHTWYDELIVSTRPIAAPAVPPAN